MRYSDFALGRFFAAARTKPWCDSTVFIIVGDHTTSPSQHDFRSIFLVPCLVLAPGLVRPGRTARIASQVDLLPTVLDLLDLPATHAATGRSLLDTAGTRFAVDWYGSRFALFTDSLLLLSALDGNPGLYDYRRDHLLKAPLQQRDRPLADSMERQVEAYLQSVYHALRYDRLCRIGDLRK